MNSTLKNSKSLMEISLKKEIKIIKGKDQKSFGKQYEVKTIMVFTFLCIFFYTNNSKTNAIDLMKKQVVLNKQIIFVFLTSMYCDCYYQYFVFKLNYNETCRRRTRKREKLFVFIYTLILFYLMFQNCLYVKLSVVQSK